MPHDNNGKLISVGDQVMIPAVVKEIYSTEEYCNVQLKTLHPMYPGDSYDTITLNAKQVVKVEGDA